jgi:transposase
LDESGFSERPSVRRTWAPRGKTPVLREAFSWKRLAAIGTLVTTVTGCRVRLFLATKNGAVKSPDVIKYLKGLKRFMRGRKLLLIWDSLPAHKSKITSDYVRSQKKWLQVEFLPPYAPDLNPVEYLWANISRMEMANFCAANLGQVHQRVGKAKRRIRHNQNLGRSFLKHSGLF